MRYGGNYTLQKTDSILLYGAATTGAILYGNLTESGFRVDGFIDRRADETGSYYGLPVWDAADARRCAGERGAAVVVAIKNVFEHERVAGSLWRAGFRRIIFRPYRSVCGGETEQDRLLNTVYDQLMDKSGVGPLSPCPEIGGPERRTLEDRALILAQDDYVTAKIPAPYVFTDKCQGQATAWGDVPCLGLLPHLGLFDMLNGSWNPDYAEYMRFCRQAAERSGGIVVSEAWEASVCQNRLDVFNHMQYAWEHDRDFFVRNAVEGVYDPKGYFNIRSGKHRITYMLAKGSRYIPLRIKKPDYEAWRARDKAERLADFLWDSGIETLPVVLPNPYFYDYPCDAPAFYERTLFSLLTDVFRDRFHRGKPLRFEGRRVLFDHTPMALYAGIFTMLGFEACIHESRPEKRALNEAVLSGVPVRCLEDLSGGQDAYDIAVFEGRDRPGDVSARTAVTICGGARDGEKVLSCGLVDGKPLYAFEDIHF